jgi:hypothetical protein
MVAIHLALLAVWAFRLELRLVFALQNQNTVSSFIAATATTFGTVCDVIFAAGTTLNPVFRFIPRFWCF